MNFQGLGKIEDYQIYLDMAFQAGNKITTDLRSDMKDVDRVIKSRKIEYNRVQTVGKVLTGHLDAIGRAFPSIDQLPPFYNELVKCTIDYELLKKSLGAINWAKKQLREIMDGALYDIKKTTRIHHFNVVRTAFSGRASSVMKQIRKNLEFLEGARKIMKGYPSLKTSVPTIAIAGMPNVGKSTLLCALTSSKPEVASYPFTTKKLNLGYDSEDRQYIDTPGLLDRPVADRNPIERQALLALTHLANAIVFIIDPTESCGYPLKEQEQLLRDIKKMFTAPVIVVSNKADIGKTYPNALAVSAKEGKGVKELQAQIVSILKNAKPISA